MKLLQCNIWGGRLEPQLLALVSNIQPDIFCMQEAIDIKGGRSALFASVEEIQHTMDAPYMYMSPVLTLNYMNRKADYGNCIVSKYPIAEHETIFTGGEYIGEYDSLEHNSNIRNLQRVTIDFGADQKIHVLNHHGHHIHQHKDGDDETMRQCKIIADTVRRLSGPVVLTGDFNLSPYSTSLEQINAELDNLCIRHSLVTTRTSLTTKTEVCDYIFVGKDVTVESFRALDDVVSDHKALLLETR